MKADEFIRKIKKYAFISFLIPLIAINACFLLYKMMGGIEKYPDFKWDEKKTEIDFDKYYLAKKDMDNYRFTTCPKYKFKESFVTYDNQILNKNPDIWNITYSDKKKIKTIIIKSKKDTNIKCVKNKKFIYFLLNNFASVENLFMLAAKNNKTGFAEIKNPYFYGEVSISRTARYFPATLIFKPLIILSGFFLFIYWKNNLNLFRELENKNILGAFSKKFFYFGLLSSIFLVLHASFLGLEYNSDLFRKLRRTIIILFIFFELCAQILLTINLVKYQKNLINYIYPLVINIKIAFVSLIFLSTTLVFALLIWGDLDTSVKHTLEWNYFSILLFYYILSRLLWKNT